jgi:hypothetical protein
MIGYYKNALIKMFSLLNDIKAAPNESLHKCFDLQILIIKSIFRIEKNIKKQKNEINNLKNEFNSLKDEESRKHNIFISATIKRKKEMILAYKDIIHIFRCVGDGIAYLFIDKYDIKPMVFKQDSGFLSGKKGFRTEMKIFRQAF